MNPFILVFLTLSISSTLLGQKINQEIKIENQQSYLVGHITIDGLNANSYKNWYSSNYANYEVNNEIVSSIKNELNDYKILVFMGTWCGDSKREVPRFIKILQASDFPIKNLKIVALDKTKERYKMSPNGEEWGLSIKRVPTFIFYKDGKEVNRIIESPVMSLEADIKAIVTDIEYIPNYPRSLHFD